ncbi:Uma2 family endonuclease [Moorena sp. SIO3H5]|uniref:Uma2 family endonuclease n=1 Tax=Moorena sp. SIO3H5 TaxID=2607834 RepID=UPI0013B8947C|nr:Uma2 family endonuclease [Moorena sp. SIO3H5]NEO73188.1 Uma2 family endonuclease [Moorena sp. SIO3H5]
MNPLTLDLRPVLRLTHREFEKIAVANRELRLELTVDGELIVMPPTGGNTGRRNADITYQLQAWNRQTQRGEVFDSSTVFQLPNGAGRSPDAAWVSSDRWNSLTLDQQETFPPLCPDFVIELRSKTDSLTSLQKKMLEYMDNGCRLGWLINYQDQQVEIYRSGQAKEILQSPQIITGEEVLPGFRLDLKFIWK